MKLSRLLIACFLCVFIFSCSAIAEEFGSFEDLESILPDSTIWKMSADTLQAKYPSNYKHCKIDGKDGLCVNNIEVSSYNMDAYYAFEEEATSSTGKTIKILSKIAYILHDSEKYSTSKLKQCYQALVEELEDIEGKAHSTKKYSSTWSTEKYNIELGIGRLEKFTGTDKITVAIIFKRAPGLTPTVPPKPTQAPKAQYSKINYKGVSRHPEKYEGQNVKFPGIVVQSQETSFVKYEGGSLLDDYYVLRVASKFEKYQYFDGYDTDDIVYVVVPKSKVEGGRILEDDRVYVYGRYDGIETYTTILGGSVSIPRVEADRVVIQ